MQRKEMDFIKTTSANKVIYVATVVYVKMQVHINIIAIVKIVTPTKSKCLFIQT